MGDLEVTLTADWDRVSRALKNGDKVIRAEFRKDANKAAKPAQKAVKAGIPRYMPSGYAPTLASSLKLRTKNRAMGVTIVAAASGEAKPRKVGDLEKGQLRHPTFGRVRYSRRRKRHYETSWHVTRIRAHFFTEPIREVRDEIRAVLADVLRSAVEKILKG